MKKDRIHIYEMESYKHASEEQRNSMRICKIRYFDLEGLPSKEVKEILLWLGHYWKVLRSSWQRMREEQTQTGQWNLCLQNIRRIFWSGMVFLQ